MRIDSVDLFYLRMPEVLDIGDGSQDMLLVRVEADRAVGWGSARRRRSPRSPAPSLLSHSACHPVADSVVGQRLDDVRDIARIGAEVRARSLDLLQAEHTLSGIEIALWDLLGRAQERPIWQLLVRPLVREDAVRLLAVRRRPQETLEKAAAVRRLGYRAAKFGWGPYGTTTVESDADHVHAAREGLGDEGILLVDAGTVFGEDVDAAALRLPALEQAGVTWLEEPFISGALGSYKALAGRSRTVRMAGERARTTL